MKLAVSALSLLATATLAHANTTRFFSATDCQSAGIDPAGLNETKADWVGRTVDGCANKYLLPILEVPTCAKDANVVLPITGNTNESVNYDGVSVNYMMNDTAAITCTVQVKNAAGTVFSSSTQNSNLTPLNPITGTITWAGATLPNAGNAITTVQTQSVFCKMPPKIFGIGENCFSAHGYSYITSYSVNTVQP